MPLPGKTTYQQYVERAQLCRLNARRAVSDWAKNYWAGVANKLQNCADNMPVCLCHKEAELMEKLN